VCEAPKSTEKLACALKDLSVGTPGERADVQGVLGASEDGSTIYFVANGVLGQAEAEGARPGTCRGETEAGAECNLYSEHFDPNKGAKGEWEPPVFIARLPSDDSTDWNPKRVAEFGELSRLTSRVSPHGRYVAFMSESPLTGYDNRDANPAAKGARDEEVFLYDSSTRRITCA